MDIIPLGDSALVVRVREQFEDAPEETLDEVLRVFQLLQRAAIPGVIELAPAYTSVAVFFDPIMVLKSNGAANGVFDEVATKIRSAISSIFTAQVNTASPALASFQVLHFWQGCRRIWQRRVATYRARKFLPV